MIFVLNSFALTFYNWNYSLQTIWNLIKKIVFLFLSIIKFWWQIRKFSDILQFTIYINIYISSYTEIIIIKKKLFPMISISCIHRSWETYNEVFTKSENFYIKRSLIFNVFILYCKWNFDSKFFNFKFFKFFN